MKKELPFQIERAIGQSCLFLILYNSLNQMIFISQQKIHGLKSIQPDLNTDFDNIFYPDNTHYHCRVNQATIITFYLLQSIILYLFPEPHEVVKMRYVREF